jgi:hypothetical protein
VVADVQNTLIGGVSPQSIDGADLYTVTAGGNDMQFDKIVKSCIYNLSGQGGCSDLLNANDTNVAAGSQFRQDLNKLYTTIKDLSSKRCTTVALTYIRFYNDQKTPLVRP